MSVGFAQLVALPILLGACRAPVCPATAPPLGARVAPPFVTAVPPLAPEPRDVVDVPAVVARTRGAIVSVIAGHANGHGHAFTERGESPREHALGSGVILTADGLVLTSRHVIVDADDVRVELDDGRSFRCKVVARDAFLDIALLRLEGARGLPTAVLGSSDAAKIGAPILVIGNAFGLGPSVTRGILSAKARAVDEGPGEVFLQTDAAVNPGDSGGPLLDAEGRVIGINTAILEHGQGVSFAVPIDDVRHVLVELLAKGRVTRGHAGISYQPVDAAIARALGLPGQVGAIITDLDAGGPAARAGMGTGDVILAIDGRKVGSAADVSHELSRRRPGELARFFVLHEGQRRAVAVLLDRAKDDADDDRALASKGKRRGPEGLGLTTHDADGGGARIDAVDPAATAADDLRPGDIVIEVNRRPVQSAADLGAHLAQATRPSTVLLRLRREGTFLYVGVDVE